MIKEIVFLGAVTLLSAQPVDLPACSKILNGKGEISPGSYCCENSFDKTECVERNILDDTNYVGNLGEGKRDWIIKVTSAEYLRKADSIALVDQNRRDSIAEIDQQKSDSVNEDSLLLRAIRDSKARVRKMTARLKKRRIQWDSLEAAQEKSRIESIQGKRWSSKIESAAISKSVLVGMTQEQALLSWGKPNDINRTTTGAGTSEQWVYGGKSYLYLVNGIVTIIQN